LAFNLAAKNIRANSVSPGNAYFPGGGSERIALNPTGRMPRREEIARAVAFIASPAANFITGINLVVDGALTRGVPS
jgi:NAD(P)-dependent dehydrogenase (short-subunit alcohol dehydrogenase family)